MNTTELNNLLAVQEEYCAPCGHYIYGGCNVILKPGEVCGDMWIPTPEEKSQCDAIDYLTNPTDDDDETPAPDLEIYNAWGDDDPDEPQGPRPAVIVSGRDVFVGREFHQEEK